MNHVLFITDDGAKKTDDVKCVTLEAFLNDMKDKKWREYFHVYDKIIVYCRSFHRLPRRFFTLVLCRWFARREFIIMESKGGAVRVGMRVLLKAFGELIRELLGYKRFLMKCLGHLESLDQKQYHPKFNEDGVPYYVRNDYVMGIIAGGSIGHIAGIANNLYKLYNSKLCFVTSDYIPTLNEDIKEYVIEDYDDLKYSNIRDVTSIYYNVPALKYLNALEKLAKPKFIYHRCAINEFSAVEFAIHNNVPLILEYNGSDVWFRKNWSNGKLGAIEVSYKVEQLAFRKAALIVCVSRPLREQLIEWGVDKEKIIVVPNGVDTDLYNPTIDGNVMREELHISGREIVIGFIGTFGAWHGVDVLAQAAADLIKEGKYNVRFLFIGDGMMMSKVRSIIDPNNRDERCIFTGIVPQNKGRDYMAACDILVSPTIPNPDGTPFFGSPTKLFEYMAMGKAIVVSDMDQMAEICENEKTALLTPPGDKNKLKDSIVRLVEDEGLRMYLGENARSEVCLKYTWEIQTRKIIGEFEKRCKP